jgi:PAS domain S-box-containing protein
VVADDNADLREYLLRLLCDDYEVEVFGNGLEALTAVRNEPPDLILTDVMMPVLDGFGLLNAIRSDQSLREIPVVMLSARAGEESKVEGLGHGADDYLVKPFSTRELMARVRSNLELAQLRKLSFRREETLRIAAQASYERMMVAERDANGRLRWANAQYYRYTGLQPGAFPQDVSLDSFHPDDRDIYSRHWAEAFETGKEFALEVRIRRYDGEMRWWHLSVNTVKRDDGVIDRFYVSATDIHDQKEAEIELERRVEQRTAELVEANRELQGFTYTVSHDLRSPLRSIIFNCAVMLEQLGDSLSDEQAELVHRQMRSARKLATVIDDLLKLSRVSRQEMLVNQVHMTAIASHVTQDIKRDWNGVANVVIQPHMTAFGDVRLLEFVYQNLIDNALKFSPNGEQITVGLMEIENVPTFFVRDSGIGFDPKYAEKVSRHWNRVSKREEDCGKASRKGLGRKRTRCWINVLLHS